MRHLTDYPEGAIKSLDELMAQTGKDLYRVAVGVLFNRPIRFLGVTGSLNELEHHRSQSELDAMDEYRRDWVTAPAWMKIDTEWGEKVDSMKDSNLPEPNGYNDNFLFADLAAATAFADSYTAANYPHPID